MQFLRTVVLLCVTFSCFGFFQEMTLEEKVGQLLLVHFQGEAANENAKTLIQKVHVGGIIYYNWANGLHSPKQILNLSDSLQRLSRENRLPIPLFIAIDQEGGLVNRLKKGFTIFPGNKALGMTGNTRLAKQSAKAIGLELRSVGINFNLAPVVDINSNPHNPIIGTRSFGDSADLVTRFAEQALKGYHQAPIITSLKHFPGHGDVDVDSHIGLPIVYKTKRELQECELLPFSQLAAQADTIMTAHIMVPEIDPIHCATLSKPLLDILREDIGFSGVIITDSLVMEGLLQNCPSIDEAATKALNAGCDILLLGGKQLTSKLTQLELSVGDIQRIHQTIVQAVKNGLIPEKRLNEAVQRILSLKNKYALATADQDKENFLFNQKAHESLAQQIAENE